MFMNISEMVQTIRTGFDREKALNEIKKALAEGMPEELYGSYFATDKHGNLNLGTINSYENGVINVSFEFGNMEIVLDDLSADELLLLALEIF